jgi:hypothetical protein
MSEHKGPWIAEIAVYIVYGVLGGGIVGLIDSSLFILLVRAMWGGEDWGVRPGTEIMHVAIFSALGCAFGCAWGLVLGTVSVFLNVYPARRCALVQLILVGGCCFVLYNTISVLLKAWSPWGWLTTYLCVFSIASILIIYKATKSAVNTVQEGSSVATVVPAQRMPHEGESNSKQP